MDPATTRRRYLRTWFGLDLASAFPFELLAVVVRSIDEREAVYTRLPRLLKLLRINFAFRSVTRCAGCVRVCVLKCVCACTSACARVCVRVRVLSLDSLCPPILHACLPHSKPSLFCVCVAGRSCCQ